MPGLPGSTPERDLILAETLFNNPDFCPDGLKLYPTVVVEGSRLEEWYQTGEYIPYPDQVMVGLMADIKSVVPGYVRIARVLRDIPSRFIIAGLRDSIREKVQEHMTRRGQRCSCIRCREYGHRLKVGWKVGTPTLRRLDYPASGGREVFLSYEDENGTLFGLLRLRLEPEPPEIFGDIVSLALVRELHIFGPELALGARGGDAAQHRGLGKLLLAEAEDVARKEFQSRTVAILSGVGARQYYREQGYAFRAGYMVKNLT
jgi:elongator complex protein 3